MKKTVDYFTGKMFRRQFTPSLISALGLAVGDMADAIVVGQQMGVVGLAAISLALPVFMIINLFMHGFGIGGSIRFSTLLAKGDETAAVRGFQGLLAAAIGFSVLLAALGNLFLPQLLKILGTTAADGDLFVTGRSYIQIIVSGMPLFFIAYILNYFLRNDENQKLAGFGFTIGNLSDIALNVVFVLMLHMGAAGAAWATLCGQIISICFYLPGLENRANKLQLLHFRPDFRGTFGCLRIGAASSVQYLFSMLFIWIANNVLLHLSGNVGVAVFDMVQNASFLILYLYDGAAKAAQPLVSTYHGEYNRAGKRRTLHIAIGWATIAGAVSMLLVMMFPQNVCRLFGLTEPAALVLGAYALRIFCLGAGAAGVSILLESYYQACGEEKSAFFLAALRGAAVLIPVTVLLSSLGTTAFWWLFPLTEWASLIIFIFWRKICKQTQDHFDPARVCTWIIQNRQNELQPLLVQLDEFCKRWHANTKQSYFVIMAAEELCTVIMEKGFVNHDGYIQITVIAQENGIFALHLRDSAVTFNPFSLHTEKVDFSDGFDMDAMGVRVIRNKAKTFYYRRYQGFNTLIVKI